MKKILLILLLPVFLFAQYGNNLLTNAENWTGSLAAHPTYSVPDEDPGITGWTQRSGANDVGHATIIDGAFGTALAWDDQGTNPGIQQTITTVAGSTYRSRVWWRMRNIGGTATDFWLRIGTSTFGVDDLNKGGTTDQTSWELVTAETVVSTTTSYWNTTFFPYTVNANDSAATDHYDFRRRLGTLNIFATGSDTDEDTVLTLSEAFEARGSHTGGAFLTEAGTYGESIIIDSSFSTWTASGGVVTVTQVNFNSVTCTVDCNIYDNIGIVLNAENVTVNTGLCENILKHPEYPDFPAFEN